MANADDPFLAWLSGLSGSLTGRQSRLVLGVLLDLLRKKCSPEERRAFQLALFHWWKPTLLPVRVHGRTFEAYMEEVRRPPRRGRRPDPAGGLRLYPTMRFVAQALGGAPTLTVFRRQWAGLEGAGILPPLPPRRLRLFDLRTDPDRLAVELLHLRTAISVKHIRRQIPGTRASRRRSLAK